MLENFKYIQNIKGNEATILLYGEIGDSIDSNGNYCYGISGNSFAHELMYLADKVDVINVRINSVGGSVLDGYSIVSAILSSPKTVNTYIDGLAASIAGVVAVAGKKCYMMDYGTLMVHNPSGGEDKIVLALIKDTLVTILSNRTQKTAEEIDTMMNAETYLSAEEAMAQGMVDEIIKSNKKIKIKTSDSLTNIALVYNKLINPTTNMEKVTNVLKLKNDASELEMVSAIEAKDTENTALKNQIETLKNELKEFKDAKEAEEAKAKEALKTKATEVVNKGFEDGKIAKEEVDSTIELASSSESAFSSVSNMLSKMAGKKQSQKPFDFKNVKTEKGNEDRSAWTYQDWTKNDQAGLIEMQNSAPEDFKNLLKTLKTTL